MRRTLGVVSIAVLAWACGPRQDPNLVVASGHVEATDVHVAAKVGGRLRTLSVREGDSVALDQELARIDTTDLQLALQQAQAEARMAEAELRLRLAGARKEDVGEAAAQLESARADLEAAERDLGRMQSLLDRGSGTLKARDDAKTRRDMSAARVAATGQALSRLKTGSRPEEIEAARARAGAAEARVAQLEQQVKDAVVISPLAGVVTEKVAEQGELLQPGAPVCVVTNLADPWLTIYVAEPDLGRLRLGQEAELVSDGGQTRQGKVTYVSTQAEFTPKNVQTRDERVKLVYKVKIGFDNRDGVFKPGMPAEARLQAAGAPR
jgi:HlyD family secretion protein